MTFCYSYDEEGFFGEYDTREAALAAAQQFSQKLVGDEPTRVWTAKNGRGALGSEFLQGAGEMLIAYAQDNSGDAEGDGNGAMPDWLDGVSADETADLDYMIKTTFDAWCTAHGHVPRLWCVTDVIEHTVPRDAQ